MASILETFPFPFHEPVAQTLRKNLADLYSNPQRTMQLLNDVGFDTSVIFFEQPAVDRWHEILGEAAKRGMTRAIVEKVHQLTPPKAAPWEFFDRLLKNNPEKPAPIDPGAMVGSGAPRFLDGDGSIGTPEALLYYDNLTYLMGRVPALIQTLQHVLELAPAVCRLEVRTGAGVQYGTGFRVSNDLLLTNWHVLHDASGARAQAVTAEFGYESDANDNGLTATAIKCSAGSIVSDQPDDWAVIRAQDPLQASWPIVKLSEAAEPALNGAAFIIQHPNGDRKRIGFVRNQITNFTDRVVHYLTDTEGGSSGAPVFDASGRLIALHHMGGTPQEVVGRQPMKKNEGIRISRVLAGLQSKGIQVA